MFGLVYLFAIYKHESIKLIGLDAEFNVISIRRKLYYLLGSY